jgi:hypothetical protein
MLRIAVNQGRDYHDTYLRPFILQALHDEKPYPVADGIISDIIRTKFGLEIPPQVVQLMLKRLSRDGLLKKEHGVFHYANEIENPGIESKKAESSRHISSVICGLVNFSQNTPTPLSESEASDALCCFLAEFDISCLKAYLRGTTIPDIKSKRPSDIVLVSEYAFEIQNSNPERFESFMRMVQGHMLANSLTCPDLSQGLGTYNDISFYFDTPLLVRLLGLEGNERQRAITNLVDLLLSLGGKTKIFSHTLDELMLVIRGAADYLNSPHGRGAIVYESRRTGKTKADLVLFLEELEERVKNIKIAIVQTPKHLPDFQIDESEFAQVLSDEINYYNPNAIEFDTNSVRSIYAIRGGENPLSLERAKAVIVTNN